MPLSIKARRQQVLTEIGRLYDELKAWQEEINLPQYTTQVESISSEVLTCADRLRNALNNLKSPSVGAAYADCVKIEKQIVWLWRAWDYFRGKFDQRRDPRYAGTLQAADEVVWSCYRPFFRQPLDHRVPEPAPLPYVELEYSPVAVRRDQGSVIGGRPDHQELLVAAFQKLPTPVLKLPASAIENPWVIALTGHEIGHFVQRMISANPLQSVAVFRETIEKAAGDAAWGSWSVEIFADWYSVLMLGQWSLHPIAQFAAGGIQENVKRGGVYPSLLVRLHLMAALADSYGFPGTHALGAIGLDQPKEGDFPEYDADRAAVPKVVQAIVELNDCRSLAERIGLRPENFIQGGLVSQWAAHLSSGGAPPATGKPDSARLAAAGSVQAWDQFVFAPPEPPGEELLETLRATARQAMKDAAMPGVRSSSAEVTPLDRDPGDVLFSFLETVAMD